MISVFRTPPPRAPHFSIKFSPLPRAPLGDVIDFSPLLRAPLVNFIEFFYPTRAPRQWLRFWLWPPGGSLLDLFNKTIKLQFFSAIVPSHSWRLLPRNTVRATVVNLWGVHATVGQIRTWKTVNSKTMRFSVILSYLILSYSSLSLSSSLSLLSLSISLVHILITFNMTFMSSYPILSGLVLSYLISYLIVYWILS